MRSLITHQSYHLLKSLISTVGAGAAIFNDTLPQFDTLLIRVEKEGWAVRESRE